MDQQQYEKMDIDPERAVRVAEWLRKRRKGSYIDFLREEAIEAMEKQSDVHSMWAEAFWAGQEIVKGYKICALCNGMPFAKWNPYANRLECEYPEKCPHCGAIMDA